IGGGPTFVGTVIGQSFINETVDIAFLALAAGSILYVVVQLLHVALKLDRRMQLMWGLFLGVMFGYATELVLVAAGVEGGTSPACASSGHHPHQMGGVVPHEQLTRAALHEYAVGLLLDHDGVRAGREHRVGEERECAVVELDLLADPANDDGTRRGLRERRARRRVGPAGRARDRVAVGAGRGI